MTHFLILLIRNNNLIFSLTVLFLGFVLLTQEFDRAKFFSLITRINIKEQKLRANPIQFFISIIKLLKSLLRGKKRYKGMIRIKSGILQASKVIDFQFHLLVIPSRGQSPFTPPLQSCSSLKTSSMVFTKRNLSIKKQYFNMNMSEISLPKLLLLWYYFKFYSTFMFYILPNNFYVVNCVKNQKQYREKIPLKKKIYIYIYIFIYREKRLYKYVCERERDTYTFFGFRNKYVMS